MSFFGVFEAICEPRLKRDAIAVSRAFAFKTS